MFRKKKVKKRKKVCKDELAYLKKCRRLIKKNNKIKQRPKEILTKREKSKMTTSQVTWKVMINRAKPWKKRKAMRNFLTWIPGGSWWESWRWPFAGILAEISTGASSKELGGNRDGKSLRGSWRKTLAMYAQWKIEPMLYWYTYLFTSNVLFFLFNIVEPLHNGRLGDRREWPLWSGGCYGEVGV